MALENSDLSPTPQQLLDELLLVQGGLFEMGCSAEQQACEADEYPLHEVGLQDFKIGKYPITVAQFSAFMQETNYQTKAAQTGGSTVWDGAFWLLREGVDWRWR